MRLDLRSSRLGLSNRGAIVTLAFLPRRLDLKELTQLAEIDEGSLPAFETAVEAAAN